MSDLVKDKIRVDNPDQRYIPQNEAGKHSRMRESHPRAGRFFGISFELAGHDMWYRLD
jgi:hypothetical protein